MGLSSFSIILIAFLVGSNFATPALLAFLSILIVCWRRRLREVVVTYARCVYLYA